MIESFNNTIDYIDTELANTIDEKKNCPTFGIFISII